MPRDPLVPADLSQTRTYPLAERRNLVRVDSFARRVDPAGSVADFLDGLSDILASRALRALAAAMVEASRARRPIVAALGAHVAKVGLGPVLIQLMEEGLVTAIALNGAAPIHDWEIAAIGATSEDVSSVLDEGRFGMAAETGEALNGAAREAAASGEGFGAALGRRIVEGRLPYRHLSIVGRAWELGVPVTIHVALGTDIVHQHASADGAAIGAATYTDFRKLVTLVGGLSRGVWLNCGSSVLLPEVFLKALSVARNLGHEVTDFVTADLDMIRHYRPQQNVLKRPTQSSGASYAITGHHELLIPLLAAAALAHRARTPAPPRT